MRVNCDRGWCSIQVCLRGCEDCVFDKCCVFSPSSSTWPSEPSIKYLLKDWSTTVALPPEANLSSGLSPMTSKWVKSRDQRVASTVDSRTEFRLDVHTLFQKWKVQWKLYPGSYISFRIANHVTLDSHAFLHFKCIFSAQFPLSSQQTSPCSSESSSHSPMRAVDLSKTLHRYTTKAILSCSKNIIPNMVT